ncbi:hypothetical protein TrVE_jg12372 [Triparma verrucosa]|uniref:Uncharacterized protein n=1 Tax=Triparma verrucosa TaxID=1606542 RepID=A0A9W7FBD7_9STRA|nr:hypothetical protein TrVE_jg12372 [Triparma verrucosa]
MTPNSNSNAALPSTILSYLHHCLSTPSRVNIYTNLDSQTLCRFPTLLSNFCLKNYVDLPDWLKEEYYQTLIPEVPTLCKALLKQKKYTTIIQNIDLFSSPTKTETKIDVSTLDYKSLLKKSLNSSDLLPKIHATFTCSKSSKVLVQLLSTSPTLPLSTLLSTLPSSSTLTSLYVTTFTTLPPTPNRYLTTLLKSSLKPPIPQDLQIKLIKNITSRLECTGEERTEGMIIGQALGCDFEFSESPPSPPPHIPSSSSSSSSSSDSESDLLPFPLPSTLSSCSALLSRPENDDLKKLKFITALEHIPKCCKGKGLEVGGILRIIVNLNNEFNIPEFEELVGDAVKCLVKLNWEVGVDYLCNRIWGNVGEGLASIKWLSSIIIEWEVESGEEPVKTIRGTRRRGDGGEDRFREKRGGKVCRNTFRDVGAKMFVKVVEGLKGYAGSEKLILNGVLGILYLLIEKTGWQVTRIQQVEIMKVLLVALKGRIDWEVGLEGVRVCVKWGADDVDCEDLVEAWREELNMLASSP